jgi:hypothetical protein
LTLTWTWTCIQTCSWSCSWTGTWTRTRNERRRGHEHCKKYFYIGYRIVSKLDYCDIGIQVEVDVVSNPALEYEPFNLIQLRIGCPRSDTGCCLIFIDVGAHLQYDDNALY